MKQFFDKTKLGLKSLEGDERGITLQTVIVTAVLAIAATAAGIIIYNAIDTQSDGVGESNVQLDQGAKFNARIGGGECAYIGDDDDVPEDVEEQLFNVGLDRNCLEVEREEPTP